MRAYFRDLKVKLTTEEWNAYSAQLANNEEKLEELEREKKEGVNDDGVNENPDGVDPAEYGTKFDSAVKKRKKKATEASP